MMMYRDYLNGPESQRLANRIKRYWANKGGPVPTMFIEEVFVDKEDHKLFCVRSNMINGMPQRLTDPEPTPYLIEMFKLYGSINESTEKTPRRKADEETPIGGSKPTL